MYKLGKINIIEYTNGMTFYSMIDFLEKAGKNIVFISDHEFKNTVHSLLKCSFIEVSGIEEFNEKINDSSNLFRCNLLIVDTENRNYGTVKEYYNELKRLDIPFILSLSSDVFNDFISDKKDEEDLGIFRYSSDYEITDIVNKKSYSFESYKKSYIRNYKLSNLFNS